MRIISGKYRGRKLISPIGNEIRPTSDVVKESIFNTVQLSISGSSFLDLFAGSGNMGIEAISRGANVCFVDSNRESVELIKRNLEKIEEPYTVLEKDYRDALLMSNEKYDYIFVDAPYAEEYIQKICELVYARGLLNEGGFIIYEHEKNTDYDLSNKWFIKKRKKFGIAVVDYIAKVKNICAFTGSFDPITNGHLGIIEDAFADFDKVQIIIASNDNKKPLFDLATRLEIAKLCLKGVLNVNVSLCEGYVYKMCNDEGIKTIIRGYRREEDMAYEKPIAQFNEENGGVQTVFYKAKEGYENISSTAVKTALKNGTSLKAFLPLGTHTNIIKLYEESLLDEKSRKTARAVRLAAYAESAMLEKRRLQKKTENGEDINKKTTGEMEEDKRREKRIKKYGLEGEFDVYIEDYNSKQKKPVKNGKGNNKNSSANGGKKVYKGRK